MIRAALLFVLAFVAAGCAMGDDGVHRRNGDGGALDGATRDAAQGRCVEGERVTCTTVCGSMGTAICTGGRPGACALPEEVCDGADQDCDGMIDDGVPDHTCTSECGGGVSRCVAGSYEACVGGTPRAETCDGTDEDCDGAIDDGLTRPCTSACGVGVERCAGGAWGGCTAPGPRAETCDGTDEDCDGIVDDGLTRRCTSACGDGDETCAGGAWVGCTAPMPGTEACNLVDDDCDGSVDEGFQATLFDPVAMSELTAAQPACDGPGARIDVCMTAAKRWCHAHAWGCFTGGGAGHLQATSTGARVVCFGSRGDERTVGFTEVSTASGITITDTNVTTRVAQSAVNRYCRSLGAEAGVGPTEHGASSITLTCLPADVAVTLSIATTELTTRGCDPVASPSTLGCSSAADDVCRARGHRSGYGPVEWNTTDSAVVCFLAP